MSFKDIAKREARLKTPNLTPSSGGLKLFRLGLVGAGGLFAYLATNLSGIITPANAGFLVPALIALGITGFILLLSAGVRRPPEFLRWLILAAYGLQVITQAALWTHRSGFGDPNLVDSGAYTEVAAALIRHGRNPYKWDYGGVFDITRSQQSNSTPLLNGASESPYPYPALPFLLAAPLQSLRLPGVFTLSVLAHIVLLILTFVATPRQWQPIILLPAMAGYDFGFLTVIGNLDILWTLALLGMVITWRRPTIRALCYGFAISLKQSPLLLAPFLLIRLWREKEDRHSPGQVARFILICAATFFACNGPFIIWDPAAWLAGYTEPARDILVIISHGGLSTLTQSGFLYLPRTFFLLATLSVFALLIFIYWRHYHQLRDAFWIMPGIVMWFSFRALVSYWLYWCLPMVLVALRHQPSVEPTVPPRSWKPTLALTVILAAGLFAFGGVLAKSTAPVRMNILLPMFAREGAIDRLDVQLTNAADRNLTPRFAIQSRRTTTNPLPWYIEDGPVVLTPGQTAVYRIVSDRADRIFFGPDPVQLVVTDAGGDYSLRGVLSIDPDPSYLWPEMIQNADFRMWDRVFNVPFAWQKSPNGSASFVNLMGRRALRLSTEPAVQPFSEVRLSTSVLFPETKLGVWLYPPADTGSVAYGLEIRDDQHHIWILFSPQARDEFVNDRVQIVHRTVPADAWVYQEVDLPAIYADLGLELPQRQRTLYRGLDLNEPVIQFGFIFAADRPGSMEAFFGPIIQSEDHPGPRALMSTTLNDPADYYKRLGQTYEQNHQAAHALEAYQLALDFAPGSPEILASIRRLEQQLAVEGP